ncbi:MAG: tRNA guanosine(34) transglycosylase Tgt [Defluviitaleaceae bacterium]|nr:tRNA guanosine(34) transglycosylase Tgt [Defluviitaleaceae bacterium]MCL2273451.1 tRNA guanosine(34) transglycosylase Tgt [Defluviitaleaceae bacterium]
MPAFFPDGTRGVVRCVDSQDLENAGVAGIVMNTYHLMTKPGAATVKALGGLHKFCNWKRPIVTDSGGFQVFSLLRENASMGEIRKDEIIFRRDGKKTILSPEKCIQSQLAYGSDVLMALDYCTHPEDNHATQAKSVATTIRWGEQCMDTFRKGLKTKKDGSAPTRQLFGIIQGGNEKALRKECAQALIQQGYSGFGFGGWPLDAQGNLTEEILAYTAELMPDEGVKYAMGVGRPENIVACVKMGYTLFDCVIPTREARHHRLYVFNEEFEAPDQINLSRPFYKYHYILDDTHRRDSRPVSAICDCLACTRYSRAYLRHLVGIGDSLGSRLATIHNLRFYTMLMERLTL